MRLTDIVVQKVITRLIHAEDYRIEILELINAEFLQFVISFFKKVATAKVDNQNITSDWYKKEFLNPNLPSDELIINSGLNKKTVSNMYNTAARSVVLDVTSTHYEQLHQSILTLVENDEDDFNLVIGIKYGKTTVDLTISESLIVINTLAVKRAQIRGGAWSTAGKRVEKYLMLTLCQLFSVPPENYYLTGLTDAQREVDFYLLKAPQSYSCEVKLMGKGNPESADVIYARKTRVFIADKLSILNKKQLSDEGIHWVELRDPNGYRKFLTVLQNLGIPCQDFVGDVDVRLGMIFKSLFADPDSETLPLDL